jgi:hypothetical protein
MTHIIFCSVAEIFLCYQELYLVKKARNLAEKEEHFSYDTFKQRRNNFTIV